MDPFIALQATIASFGAFLPTVVEVRHFDPDNERHKSDVRMGMFFAGLWSFVVAAHYADKGNSARPYAYWIGGVVVMIAAYEYFLRERHDIDIRNGD